MPIVQAPDATPEIEAALAGLPMEPRSGAELLRITAALTGPAAEREFAGAFIYRDRLEADLGRKLTDEEWQDVVDRLWGALGDILDDDLGGYLEATSGIGAEATPGDEY